MILTVTPNPALDITMRVSEVEWGETNRVAASVRRAGGKGLNVARVLTQQREHAHAIAPVGADDLGFFDRDLAAVPHTLILDPANPTRRSIAVVEGSGAHRVTLFNEAGHPTGDAVWSNLIAAAQELLPEARCLVVSGSTPPGFPPERLRTLIAAAAEADIPLVADLSAGDLLLAAECGATLLKPNRRELREATGEEDPVVAARGLIDRGAGSVVVSLGEDGMLLVAADGTRHGRSPVRLGNPTGAGDAAVASFAAHLADGTTDGGLMIARAIAWATASLAAPEAGLLGADPDPILAEITVDDLWSPA